MDTEVTGPKGLDEILSAAIDANPLDPPAETAPVAEAEPASETGRPRDERGRFVPGEAKPSDGPVEASPPTAETAPTDPALKPVEPPRNFTADQKAQFAKLDRQAQEWVAATEKEREAEYTRRSQETAELKRTAEPVLKAIEPFKQYLTQLAPSLGQTPEGMLNAILTTEYTLRHGNDAQRLQAFAMLAQTYGVNLAALTGGQPMAPAQYQPQQVISTDPVLAQRLEALEQQNEQALQAHLAGQIDAFRNAKDDKGQAKYPHFERLRPNMALIIQAGEASTFEDAYAKAMEPFNAVLEQELAARQKALDEERQAAITKAKKAAPVRSSTGTIPNGTAQARGLDAILNSAMERAGIT